MNCDHHLGFDFSTPNSTSTTATPAGRSTCAYEAHKADEKAAADEEATR